MIQNGQMVRVAQHGSSKWQVGRVLIISGNGLAICVAFDHLPPFMSVADGVMIHPEHGFTFFASRVEVDGKPWGPWVELGMGGHYEIEVEGTG